MSVLDEDMAVWVSTFLAASISVFLHEHRQTRRAAVFDDGVVVRTVRIPTSGICMTCYESRRMRHATVFKEDFGLRGKDFDVKGIFILSINGLASASTVFDEEICNLSLTI